MFGGNTKKKFAKISAFIKSKQLVCPKPTRTRVIQTVENLQWTGIGEQASNCFIRLSTLHANILPRVTPLALRARFELVRAQLVDIVLVL